MAVKIRKDLVGVVYLAGKPYKAGDTVPDGVAVGAHVAADGKDHGLATPAASGTAEAVGEQPDPLTEDEQATATELGIPTDAHPERVRGAIVGYQEATRDALARAAVGTEFDPDAVTVDEVVEYLAQHPDEAVAVVAREAAGQARKGVLDQYV